MRALLALEDGSLFWGESIGAPGQAIGETVFNTAMTGYQEILSDPSYCRQIVTLTTPHIGNVGVNAEDAECARVFAAGLVIRDTPTAPSNWRAERGLTAFLCDTGVVAIAGIDTRRLTRRLREHGAQDGCLWAGDDISPEPAIAAARAFPGLAGSDLARVVSTQERYAWKQGVWTGTRGFTTAREHRWHVVAYDFGIKRNILRMLAARGCHISVVPATTPATEVLAMRPDGVFLSNGPGDPEPCTYAVETIRVLVGEAIPIFGICLGYQLLALASGARTSKMKFGHHGANHPVRSLDTGRVIITSQNHGFAVDEDSLPETLRATHRSLFDATLQGVERNDAPAFGFQGHPEASPGPQDAAPLFDHFISLMTARAEATA